MTNLKTPVMLLFFIRPEQLKRVFEAVRQYQPTELFLVQDGARPDHPDDQKKVEECRRIVSDIDWECKVYRNYSDFNMSCDHREFTGISWCFEKVDRLIILEDDCVPNQSFFGFCDAMLEKYRDDSRIHSVCGFNRLGTYNSQYDYVFSKTGSGWGWATWKRTWSLAESLRDFSFLKDQKYLNVLQHLDATVVDMYGDVMEQGKKLQKEYETSGIIPSWEYLSGMVLVLNDMYTITPTKNLIHYIGISEDATHCTANAKLLSTHIFRLLTQPSYELAFPLREPVENIRDLIFEKKNTHALKGYPVIATIEVVLKRIRYTGIKNTWRAIKKRVSRNAK